jgi:polyvinyl alcohol dehydrogenase (cytochrome)
MDPTNLVDAVVSVDLNTGTLNWSRRLQGTDTWNFACGSQGTCLGYDYDFGSSPNLQFAPDFVGMPDDRGGTAADYLLGAGQKSGIYWGLNPYNGGLFWSTFVGNGAILWGSALNISSRATALVSLENGQRKANMLAGINGVPQTSNAGAWGAINLATGQMIWQIPAIGNDADNPSLSATAGNAVAYSNGLMFAGSSSGTLAAIDANTGKVYWKFDSTRPTKVGPAIFNDTVYWVVGHDYDNSGSGPQLYAFATQ